MRKLRMVAVFLLICIPIMGFFGCTKSSPTATTKEYLEEIKKGENGDFTSLLNKTLDKSANKTENKTAATKEDESSKKLSDCMKKLTYTIISEKIDGNNATVNVKVNGPDVGGAMIDYMQKGITLAFSSAFSGKEMTQEENDKLYQNLFLETLNNMKYTDRTGNISLTKVDNKWKINADDSLTKLLLNVDNSMFNTNTTDKATANKEIKEMTLNLPFTVETEYGNYTLTMEGARTTAKRNEFSEIKVTKVVFLDYSYANVSFGEKDGTDLYIDSNAFQVLDDEGNVMDTYPVDDENRTPKNTSPKGKSKGSIAYALTTNSKNLNVTFVRDNDKVSKIIIPIK